MTDAVICDRCEEAVERKSYTRNLRMTVEATTGSKAATSTTSAEFDLCEDCSVEFHEWADVRKPRGYRDDDGGESDDDTPGPDALLDTEARVEWEGNVFTLDGVESHIETQEAEVAWAEFSGYVTEVERADV